MDRPTTERHLSDMEKKFNMLLNWLLKFSQKLNFLGCYDHGIAAIGKKITKFKRCASTYTE